MVPATRMFTMAAMLCCFYIRSTATTDDNGQTLDLKQQQFVCVKQGADLSHLNANETGNAQITDDNRVEFLQKPNLDATFYALTPCQNTHNFNVTVDAYNPNKLPNASSCRTLFETTMEFPKGACKIGNENVTCEQTACKTFFNLTCNLTDYTAPIEGHPNAFFFQGNIRALDEGYPCLFKFTAYEGFRLLLKNATKSEDTTDTLEDCLPKKECPFADDQTSSQSPPTGTSHHHPQLAACLLTWPFILVLILLFLLTIAFIVLLIYMLCCRKKAEKAEEGSRNERPTKRSSEHTKRSDEYISRSNEDEMADDINDQKLTKSICFGNYDPNIEDNTTLFETKTNRGTGSLTMDNEGVAVPPTREEGSELEQPDEDEPFEAVAVTDDDDENNGEEDSLHDDRHNRKAAKRAGKGSLY